MTGLRASPDHSAFRAADPYAFHVVHARQAWLLRLAVVMIVVLGASAGFLASMIPVLVPLKEVRLALLRMDPADDRLYRVEPITKEVAGFDLLMEQIARRYVRLLLEIDPVSQKERFREAFAMTGKGYFERFKHERLDSGELDDAIASGLNRSIAVESAERISERGGIYVYAVDFIQEDHRDGRLIERKPVRAYLSITMRPHEVREAEKFENPLGFRVLDLSLKTKPNRGRMP